MIEKGRIARARSLAVWRNLNNQIMMLINDY
jgi:hypothetical protein